MSSLSFEAKRLLVLYRKFYGKNYSAVKSNNQNAHVMAQKMCYLLGLVGVDAGDYGYVWDQFGPYSEMVQNLVRQLDEDGDIVKEFYDKYPEGTASDEIFFSDDPNPESLFRKRDLQRVEALQPSLDFPIDNDSVDEFGDTPMRRWAELLGSVAYISQSVLPGKGPKALIDELTAVKEKYNSKEETDKALRVLREAKLLTCIEF